MQIRCPACHQTFLSEGSRPRFCSQCGSPLSVTDEIHDGKHKNEFDEDDQPTIRRAHQRSEDLPTMAPGGNFETRQQDSQTHPVLDADSLTTNTTIGPYRIIRKLGQGGMGSVFEAEHLTSGQVVALKLLSSALLATDDSVERFKRESQIAASINHPRSTFVYEAGQFDEQFYITMELMTGGTLKEVVEEQGPLPVDRAVDFVLDIIDGLQPAHNAGIVHRDLKPSNCFIDHGGRVKIGDFGLAKSFLGESTLTRTGTFMGTPQFAAPEQLRSAEVDQQTDIYALGGTLFYLLSGRAPFVGNAAQVIASIASDQAPDIRTIVDGIPKELARAIQQSLEKDPTKRQENLIAFRSALLPFSARGVSQADLGRRLAAFFVDTLLAAIVVVLIAQMTAMAALLLSAFVENHILKTVNVVNIFVQFGGLLAYFAISEWKFGRTVGKWLMGMRVIDQRNEPPRLVPALIRASMVPGLSQLSVTVPTYLMGFEIQPGMDAETAIEMAMKLQAFSLLSWIPNLLCMSTARLKNGYRGIHDLVSRTRVVRLAGALENKRPASVPVTLPVSIKENEEESEPGTGSLVVVGRFSKGQPAASDVLLAKDVVLYRDVWLVPTPELSAAEPAQFKLRPTKIRTLARREIAGNKWLVTEAIKGTPLLEFLETARALNWSSLLPLLEDVVDELKAAEQEPKSNLRLDCQQIWIDQAGMIKFVMHAAEPTDPSTPPTPTASAPVEIIEQLLASIIKNHIVPEHVLTLREKLNRYRTDPDAMHNIRQQLEAMEDHPSSWRWDDRLGVVAATLGIEYSTLFSSMLAGSFGSTYLFEHSVLTLGLVTFLISSSLILIFGYLFRGGPAFRLSGVSVRRNSDLEPASAIRCAVRGWVSWSLGLVLLCQLAMLIDIGIKSDQLDIGLEDPNYSPIVLGGFIGIPAVLFLLLLGFAFSIFRPSRGIADLICGTKLIRK